MIAFCGICRQLTFLSSLDKRLGAGPAQSCDRTRAVPLDYNDLRSPSLPYLNGYISCSCSAHSRLIIQRNARDTFSPLTLSRHCGGTSRLSGIGVAGHRQDGWATS